VSVMQWTRDSSVASTSALFMIFGKKAKTNEASHTFAVRAGMRDRRSARRANSDFLLVRINDVHDVKIWKT
jgi:hypothetical protein